MAVHGLPRASQRRFNDRIDADLIATARTSIDLASYALTDRIVLEALAAAQRRGVAIRIVLDPRERHDFVRLGVLADTVRVKRGGALMHLKAYEIDRQVLRTGSANFSASGENAQDNDLIVIRNSAVAQRFEAHFERMWSVAQSLRSDSWRSTSSSLFCGRRYLPRQAPGATVPETNFERISWTVTFGPSN